MRGGLASWQQKKIADYIEDRLDEEISLRDLAAIAQLSPFHFARAFKQSFGEPPHRYHMVRRMERAKALLKVPARTVTEVALKLGFSETSSFTAAFRRSVGTTHPITAAAPKFRHQVWSVLRNLNPSVARRNQALSCAIDTLNDMSRGTSLRKRRLHCAISSTRLPVGASTSFRLPGSKSRRECQVGSRLPKSAAKGTHI
jgi:AraC-like DNA-binding protein